MSKINWTEGVICRDRVYPNDVVFYFNCVKENIVETPEAYWTSNGKHKFKTWLPETFKALYGYTPRIGSKQEIFLEL